MACKQLTNVPANLEHNTMRCKQNILCLGSRITTRVRPVLVKNIIILASYVSKQMDIYLKKNCTLLERLPQRRHVWPNPILV